MPVNDTYTISWITANADQTMAAEEFFDQVYHLSERKSPGDSNQYILGKMGKYNVVMVEMPDVEEGSSTSAAAKVLSDMMRTFKRIRVALFVGTGSGVYSDKHRIRLGDVVVSLHGAFQYNYKATAQKRAFRDTGRSVYAPDSIKAAAQNLSRRYLNQVNPLYNAVDNMIGNFPSRKKKHIYERPSDEHDRLYKADFTHQQRAHPCHVVCGSNEYDLEDRPPLSEDDDSPAVHLGLIASTNKLFRDPDLRDQLIREKNVLCFESEAAGLMSTFPCLLIRGITDYADTHSNTMWHGYAAAAASAYTRHLLHALDADDFKAERIFQSYVESNQPRDRTLPTSSSSKSKPPVNSPTQNKRPVDAPPLRSGGSRDGPNAQDAEHQEMIGQFIKSEIDSAIRRDRKAFQADLLQLVKPATTFTVSAKAWTQLRLKIDELLTKWNLSTPALQEGKKTTRDPRHDVWQKIKPKFPLGQQTRFYTPHRNLPDFANEAGAASDGGFDYENLQILLSSIWSVVNYMGVVEEAKV